MATRTSAVTVKGLCKSFGDKVVIDGIDLDIRRGTVFALLGPNGAGKTTIVHVLSTLIRADEGVARVAGYDVSAEPDEVRARIGMTGQFSAVDGLLTGAENLRLMADLNHLERDDGRRRAADLLELFELTDEQTKPAMTYSGGQRRRLDLAMTLIGDPEIVFLDEPTTGLDPGARRNMWRVICELAGRGVTIFLTTQYLDEADELADRIAVLDRGRIVAEGTPSELKRLVPGGHIRLHFTSARKLRTAAAKLTPVARDDEALTIDVPSDGGVQSLRALLDRLDSLEIDVDRLALHTPDLDDVFFALTSRQRQEELV